MKLSLGRWRPRHLLLGWGAYWATLVGVTLGPAIGATWRATHLPGGHGTISAGFSDGIVNYTVIEDGVTTWAGTAPFGSVLLWVIGPPLALWLVSLVLRSRGAPEAPEGVREATGAAALAAGMPPAGEWAAKAREAEPVERRGA